MAITKEILDELLKDYQKPEDLLGQSILLQQLSKALIELPLDGEITHHLGYEKHSPEGRNSGNSRNGKSRKRLKGKQGEIAIEVPRDRKWVAELKNRGVEDVLIACVDGRKEGGWDKEERVEEGCELRRTISV
jgi:transposase-like protein